MWVEKRDGSGERLVLTGMLVTKQVLGPIAAKWPKEGLFGARWSNLIGTWAVSHYRKYRKAPGPNIVGYFDRWAAENSEKDVTRAVESFLAGLSEDWKRQKEQVNPEYVLDQAGLLFRRVQQVQLKEQLEGLLEDGETEKIDALIRGFRAIEVGIGSGINPVTDTAAVEQAFDTPIESIVQYPDALGGFFGTALRRGAFVGFTGKAKGGKSYWLRDLAVRAVQQGRRTAYFEVGDNTQSEVLRLLASRYGGVPVESDPYFYPTDLGIPSGRNVVPAVERRKVVPDHAMTKQEGLDIYERLGEECGKDNLMVSCHHNSSINVYGLESILEGWAVDGWSPDVIVLDYADILAPLEKKTEDRDQINATWKALRALSQRLNCLLVTATQGDAESYDTHVLKRRNFSGDRRKNDHVTLMVGINQDEKEKREEVFRLNAIHGRTLKFGEEKCVYTAACLAVANPAVLSTFGTD
jgi:hypothetical protein